MSTIFAPHISNVDAALMRPMQLTARVVFVL